MKKEQVEKQAVKTINQQLSEQLMRVKTNYRVGLTSKQAIITESRKSISAALRTAIKSLLINKMSDSNVDLINVLFVRKLDDTSNFSSVPEKYTIIRSGEFVQCSIDNYLTDSEKMCNTIKCIISIWYTDIETFESKFDSIPLNFSFPEMNASIDDFIVLNTMFNNLCELI